MAVREKHVLGRSWSGFEECSIARNIMVHTDSLFLSGQ
jgi:hypothetical protein